MPATCMCRRRLRDQTAQIIEFLSPAIQTNDEKKSKVRLGGRQMVVFSYLKKPSDPTMSWDNSRRTTVACGYRKTRSDISLKIQIGQIKKKTGRLAAASYIETIQLAHGKASIRQCPQYSDARANKSEVSLTGLDLDSSTATIGKSGSAILTLRPSTEIAIIEELAEITIDVLVIDQWACQC